VKVVNDLLGMEHSRVVLTGERQSTGRETCLSATLSTTNSTRTGLDRTWVYEVKGRQLIA
jgi:hypothetical protein